MSTMTAPLATLAAAFLMLAAGMSKKRLRWRTTSCPVCHHTRATCTCRWL